MKRSEALEIIDEAFRDRPLVMTCARDPRGSSPRSASATHTVSARLDGSGGGRGRRSRPRGQGPLAAVEGDGSLLMGFSVLPTIHALAPPGFTLVVLDNHEHASADRMATHAAGVARVRLPRIGLRRKRPTTDGTSVCARDAGIRVRTHRRRRPDRRGHDPDVPLLLENRHELAIASPVPVDTGG